MEARITIKVKPDASQLRIMLPTWSDESRQMAVEDGLRLISDGDMPGGLLFVEWPSQPLGWAMWMQDQLFTNTK